MKMPFLLLPLVLLLAACAGAPGRPAFLPLACPEQPHDGFSGRMTAAAQAEWQAFGGAVIDWRGGRRQVVRTGRSERDPAVADRLRGFWQAVPTAGGRLYANAGGRSRPDAPDFDVAWSAAFISWLACGAGVPAGEFIRHEAHYAYLDGILTGGAGGWFRAAEVLAEAPLPGDLVCLDRSSATARLSSLAERSAEIGQPRPMHCDLVVAVAPGLVQAIGGNVEDTVALSLYPTDAAGRLQPLGAAESATWLAVLRAMP